MISFKINPNTLNNNIKKIFIRYVYNINRKFIKKSNSKYLIFMLY